MRILFISHSFEIGGVEKLIQDLSDELKKRGHKTKRVALFVKGSLYSEQDSKCLAPFIFDIGFIRRIKPIFYPLFFLFSPVILWRLRREIIAFKPDVLHLNMWGADIFGSVIGKELKIRMVSTQHDEVRINFILRWLKIYALKHVDVIVAISGSIKCFVVDYFKADTKKIDVIYNGVNLDKFINCRKKNEKWVPVFGSVGRLARIKGHIFVLEALKILRNEGFNALRFIFVGGGVEENRMRDFIKNNDLRDIEITGETNNITAYLSKIDVFILPSLSEGLGIVLIEALAAGKLIVATNTGGVQEIVKDGETGILIPPGDPESLARVIKSILLDRQKAIEFKNKATAFFDDKMSESFDFQTMVKNYEVLYDI